jgi:hypothetical protein
MPPITFKERQKVNHELKRVGFGGLEDPNLFAQIATLYDTHDKFRGLLMSTHPDQRRIAYEALRPHLPFTPKPLDVYEREVKERAEREQWDVYDGTAYPKPFQVQSIESDEYKLARLANEAIAQNAHEKARGSLEMVCTRCTFAQVFRSTLRRDAEKESHAAGWRSDGKKTYCPEHVPGRCTMRIACEVCETEEKIRCWEPQDGYVKARLAGWVIQDAATCPGCAAKRLVLQ